MKISSSTLKEFHTIPPPRGALDATGRSLAISPKTSLSAGRKKTLDEKKQVGIRKQLSQMLWLIVKE
ncbi:hypothetical protein R6Z07F_007684 [Ovis aries]